MTEFIGDAVVLAVLWAMSGTIAVAVHWAATFRSRRARWKNIGSLMLAFIPGLVFAIGLPSNRMHPRGPMNTVESSAFGACSALLILQFLLLLVLGVAGVRATFKSEPVACAAIFPVIALDGILSFFLWLAAAAMIENVPL